MKKIALRIFAIIFAATFAAMLLPASLCAKNIPSCEEILGIAKGIIEYEKSANGSRDFLLDDKLIAEAGTLTATDWYAFAMARLGLDFDRIAYIATAEENVAARYRESGALDPSRATEWHRISLCLLACGGDPAAIVTEEGNINLISDGVYNRGNTAPLGRQGINGLIWGLLALDSIGYDVPEGSHDTRESIISGILSEELPNGGFCFLGDEADADITAMALTALAPYYNDETRYNVTVSGEVRSVAVHEAVDRAVALLSEMQCETGDFMSFGAFGERNCESTCQVAIALCALGINPFSDPRFVKNGNSVWDGIIRYRGDDGGFSHAGDIAAEDLGSGGLFVGGQLQKAPAFLVLIAQSLGADQFRAAHAGAQLTADLAKGHVGDAGHRRQIQLGVDLYVSDVHERLLCVYCVSAGYFTTKNFC